MRHLVPVFVALIVSLGAHAQESETVSYERLASMASEVVSEYLNGSLCSPGPDLAEKQAELAKLVSRATASTGPTVLEIAVMANSFSDVQRLQEGGAIPFSPFSTLLHTAATYGSPAILEYLVKTGFGIEDVGEANMPALGVAVMTGNVENAKWFIANGANVNATDTSGNLLILGAVICGDQAIVDLLLEAGAGPDPKAQELALRTGISLESQSDEVSSPGRTPSENSHAEILKSEFPQLLANEVRIEGDMDYDGFADFATILSEKRFSESTEQASTPTMSYARTVLAICHGPFEEAAGQRSSQNRCTAIRSPMGRWSGKLLYTEWVESSWAPYAPYSGEDCNARGEKSVGTKILMVDETYGLCTTLIFPDGPRKYHSCAYCAD